MVDFEKKKTIGIFKNYKYFHFKQINYIDVCLYIIGCRWVGCFGKGGDVAQIDNTIKSTEKIDNGR